MTTIGKYLLYSITCILLLASCNQPEETIPVKKNIEDAVFASGHVEQENSYTVAAKVDGIILSLPVKEGQSVAKGDIVAIIENDVQDNQLQDALVVYNDALKNANPASPQLQNIQTQIDQAKQQLAFDEENYQRYKELSANNSVSQLDFEKVELQYKAAQSNLMSLEQNYREVESQLALNVERSKVQVETQRTMLKDYKLTTEVSGTVINVFKKQGELARRGEAISKIGSGTYVIKLFVAEEDITRIDIGLPVAVNINTYPDETFMANVTRVYPGFDATEQSYIVEAQFEKLPEKMFSGTQLQANIQTGNRKNVLVIPTKYVSRGNYVLLANGEEKQIVTGNKNSDWTEVKSGITELDVIIKPKT